MNQDYRDRERSDGADFHERAEIIPRRQQHPHRQDRRRQPVNHDRPSEPSITVSKPSFDRRIVAKKLAAPDGAEKPDNPERSDPAEREKLVSNALHVIQPHRNAAARTAMLLDKVSTTGGA
jgi:hypothetical protein